MPKTDYDSLTLQTLQDLGSNLTGEVAKKGYTFSEFAGLNIITTIKYEIYRPGNVYVFANEDFVGRNYILNDMKFYVDKKKNIISWCAWFDLGMAIINTAGVKKIELYGGSTVPTQTDTGYAVMDPFAEEQLNTVNNRIIQGVGPYPTISIY